MPTIIMAAVPGASREVRGRALIVINTIKAECDAACQFDVAVSLRMTCTTFAGPRPFRRIVAPSHHCEIFQDETMNNQRLLM
jgi:hypothetical protein